MNDWTLGSFFFWLAVAVLVPGLLVHFTLGQKGGHRLFHRDHLSASDIRRLPVDMLRKRTIWNMQGSAAALLALLLAAALYPLACLIGLPLGSFGTSDQKLVYFAAGAVVVLATLGPALYRKWRGN